MNICLLGKAGSGKDTVADYLVTKGFHRRAFADKLKEIAIDLFGMTQKDRALLQQIGDKMREIQPNVWLDYLFRNAAEPCVITDCRMPNEYEACRSRGWMMVRVVADEEMRLSRLLKRDGEVNREALRHHSESDLDDYPVDVTLDNNGSFEELYRQIERLGVTHWRDGMIRLQAMRKHPS